MKSLLIAALTLLVSAPAALADRPEGAPLEGECVVCVRRGGGHGVEEFVAWRTHEGKTYGFCNAACGEAFDQMPLGYADPLLPRPAPGFRWTTLDDTAIEPNSQTALFVDFWATWCKPCLEAVPELEQLADDYADRGVRVVGVSIDEELSTLDRFLERRPIDYAIVHDGGDDPAWWQFQVPAIPAAFLLDGEGNVVAQWSGEIDVDAVREAIEAALASAE